MAKNTNHNASEIEAREMAESAREAAWEKPGFVRGLFLGDFHLEYIYPFPGVGEAERPEYVALWDRLRDYLLNGLDPLEIDATGEFPEDVIERLAEIGALGLNIPSEFGGQGLTKREYARTSMLAASHEGSIFGFMSPHQSVGVPECIKLFGTEDQKEHYLRRCANGDVSAFALTETDVGSDPARVSATLAETPEGDAWLLNGEKLWCTNGTVAKLLVVVARHPDTGKLSAVIVETEWPGVEVTHRCRFMGMSALQNGVIKFTDVRVPKANLIGQEGKGLRIALTALNTGRLSVPYAAVGAAKKGLEVARTWAAERVQWGKAIGKHEIISHKLADIAATVFGMESAIELACQLCDGKKHDIRLEAAAAKEWNTSRAWEILDDVMQIRGGRGYEKETSLLARGERPMPVERLMRDWRVARIFEGSSEIMHLLMAREAVDKHLEVAGSLVLRQAPLSDKLTALPQVIGFYSWWYPSRYVGLYGYFGFRRFGPLATHLRFVERSSRKLARQAFHGMVRYQAKLEHKQAFLFRCVDIVMTLYVMAAACSRAQTMADAGLPEAEAAREMADMLCRNGRAQIGELFRRLWYNDDCKKTTVGDNVLAQRYRWLEMGIVTLDEIEKSR
ncbi:MAG: acyl-CoA dehydrogenase family protein [Candidatus Hydrogenedentota bacterium]